MKPEKMLWKSLSKIAFMCALSAFIIGNLQGQSAAGTCVCPETPPENAIDFEDTCWGTGLGGSCEEGFYECTWTVEVDDECDGVCPHEPINYFYNCTLGIPRKP